MASTLNFVEFICQQIEELENVTYKKMFGEYLVYVNSKPIFLICNDTLFVKDLEETRNLKLTETGIPYKGAKEHFIVENVDDREFMVSLGSLLERITPLPKPRKKKEKS